MRPHLKHDIALRAVCQRLLADAKAGQPIPPAGSWLLNNFALLRLQTQELREALSPRYWKKLGGGKATEPKILRLANQLVRTRNAAIDRPSLTEFFQPAQRETALCLAEVWAIQPVVKLALMNCLTHLATEVPLDSPESEETIRNAITSFRKMDQFPWNDIAESLSAVDRILREDPSGTYARMDFETRDQYRRAVERVGKGRFEVEAARQAIDSARAKREHVGWSLKLGLHPHPAVAHGFYFGGLLLFTTGLLWFLATYLSPMPWWEVALLTIPVTQAALTLVNLLAARLFPPHRLPRLEPADGVPQDCCAFIVIPTLLLSRGSVESLLERIEIHYLANRDPNLLFGLLTDVRDAPAQTIESDSLVGFCAAGIRKLNERYGDQFYLFHRERTWNDSEGAWMGRERKRGKLDDFNDFLLGRNDVFAVKVGALGRTQGIRFVITLDTDTQLPRDGARELVATLAHPLNREYGLLQPRVSISLQSARKSRLANLYSGQTGLDPYTKAVSDVYQDLFGRATYTGKGIYDLAKFAEATRDQFPSNTLLSHDLIEGEYAHTGLASDMEVIDDFPTTYEAFSKRKHRWVRGDWQIAAWLLPRVPDAHWHWGPNPLGGLSRWKIFDNLRRSLYEIGFVAFFLSVLFSQTRNLRSSLAIVGLLLLPAAAQAFFSLLRLPPLRFWRIFLREIASQLVLGAIDGLVQLTFLLHQSLLMADAIVRTLVRRLITCRKLLEWESAAQAEAGGAAWSLPTLYLLACPILATLFSFIAALQGRGDAHFSIFLMVLWATAPVIAEFLSHRIHPAAASRQPDDTRFLRGVALRTWRYFVDFGGPDEHWLVPDNVQEEPRVEAYRSSPTNMGLQIAVNAAAYDFGYLTATEALTRVERTLDTLQRLDRSYGHFYNWYDTRSLRPLAPRYISSVDSGNLAACLIVWKHFAAELLEAPPLSAQFLEALRDHCQILRESLPHGGQTGPIMRQIAALERQLDGTPQDLFHWEGLLSEARKTALALQENVEWLCGHWQSREQTPPGQLRFWMRSFRGRLDAGLGALRDAAPWLDSAIVLELRILASDDRMRELMRRLGSPVGLIALDAHYDGIQKELSSWGGHESLVPATRRILIELQAGLAEARSRAKSFAGRVRVTGAAADRLFHEMDFRFLLDPSRKLMRIGFDVETRKLDESVYDLLASEARTAVFLAIAKGDFPRDAWFRLGRKLTSYRGCRTLLSWSGTMFEYLMPSLFLRTFEESLLDESLVGAVRIQQLYCRTKRVPWGVSEAAYSERDAAMNYQYRAFGIPVLGIKRMDAGDLVVAPYASMLALPIDPKRSLDNLRNMADRGWIGEYGFFESVDYTGPQAIIVQAFMVHHQGMGFLALANGLLGHPMPRRFHAEPMVIATELLLQERLPAMVEDAEAEEVFDHSSSLDSHQVTP